MTVLGLAQQSLMKFKLKSIGRRKGMDIVRLTAKVQKAG
jgi:hypothetical protein